MALLMILMPKSCSEFCPFKVSKALEAYSKAQPPPTTTPSSIAALVAQMASWTRSLTSPTSTSDPPPTLKMPTPPTSLESLSSSFSLSYELVAFLICYLIWLSLSSNATLSPLPFRMTVSYLEISIFPAVPRIDGSESSRVIPRSSEITVEPVNTAISLRIAFLLSPNDGALTAQT